MKRKLTKKEERRMLKYLNTNYFTWYNANPKGKITGDCVIRALATATGKEYNDVLDELVEIQKKTGLMLNCKECYYKYLEKNGFIREKQPRKEDNTKYTGKEFCEQLAYPNCVYVVHIGGHHVVAIVDNKINDTWDSSEGTVGVIYKRITG